MGKQELKKNNPKNTHNKITKNKPFTNSQSNDKQKTSFNKGITNPTKNINKGHAKQLENNKNNKSNKPNNDQQGFKSDQRFAKASFDPKFLRPKQQLTKVKIDDRFSKMLTDPAFMNKTKVDKYGRKIQETNEPKRNQTLNQFYQLNQKDQQESQINSQQDQSLSDNQQVQIDQQDQGDYQDSQVDQDNQEGQDSQDNEQENQDNEQNQDRKKDLSKWMQEYSQQSSSLQDMPIQQLMQDQNQGLQLWSDSQQNVIKNPTIKATKRLALCSYDWMNINSTDLMILFNSFKPPTGLIKSIKVYQSNIGKEKMENEEKYGPQGIWKDEEEGDFQDEELKKKVRKSWKQLLKGNENNSLDNRKLRAYEKDRLKYYYAVIQCDHKKTADQIYKECDGNQFQNSNLQFDLRFIPDEITFDQSMLKEQCKQMPVKGQVKNFVNRAMGHSKVELTWEDPELGIAAGLKKKNWGNMTQQELEKIDWGTYLNQGQSEQEDQKRQLFVQRQDHQVMTDWKRQCNKKYRSKDSGKQQLVISFDSGFSSKPSKTIKQSAPSINKQNKSRKELRQRAQEERLKRKADLELMVDQRQGQKLKNFNINVNDERFNAVYKNPLFSIDPSNSKFDHRKSGKIFQQVVQRNKNKNLK